MTGLCQICEKDVPVDDNDRAVPHPSSKTTKGLCGGSNLKVLS